MLSFKRWTAIALVTGLLFGCSKPEATFHDNDGRVVSLKTLKGSWVFIHFWASWCGPCAKEMEALNQFYQANQQSHVKLYGVNYDHIDASRLADMKKSLPMQFPSIIEDPAAAWELDDVNVLPTTYIMDPANKVVAELKGPQTVATLTTKLTELKAQYNQDSL